MTMTRNWIITILAVALLCGCGKKGDDKGASNKAKNNIPVDTALQSRLKDFTSRPRVDGKFGVYVYDLTAAKPVYGYQEKLAQPSASCMKLLTGVAALHLLGPDYHYKTSLYLRGTMKKDTLMGDVIFQGGLDPQFQETDLSRFAKKLRSKGIKRIKGKVRLCLAFHDPVKSEAHWYPWDLSFSKYGLFYKGAPRVRRAFKYALAAQGIQVADSQLVYGPVTSDSRWLYRYYRGIEPVLKRMWKNSSNTQATAMLYTIGMRYKPHAVPTEAGVEYLRKFLREDLGMKDSTLTIHDGCGLCTHNHLSPEALVSVLRYGYSDPAIRPFLKRDLSVAGKDGTLARTFSDPVLRGKVYAKTGTLSHPFGISSLSGFCKGSNGHLLAFSIMTSEMSVLDAHVLQRKLCKELVK